MSIPYDRVEKALRQVGLRSFSKRKLQRWATPVEVRDAKGKVHHLGLLSGGKRRGKGQGLGWDWTLSENDILAATFIEYALDRMAKRDLGGDGLGDAGLWAFLWGAPIQLLLVRHYITKSLDRTEKAITARLESRKRYDDDEPMDLISRLAKHLAYDDVALKKADVPLRDREHLGEHALAHATGRRWGLDHDTAEFYQRFTESYFGAVTQTLSGSDRPVSEEFFAPFNLSRIGQDQHFFSFKHLRRLYRDCPDEWLLQIQQQFSGGQRFLDAITDAIHEKRRIPEAVMEQAKRLRDLYTTLSKLPPEAVMSLLLWEPATHPRGSKGGPTRTPTGR